MNKHTYHYLKSHDIDLFFRSGTQLIHCATNGGIIPASLNIIKNINDVKRIAWNLENIIPIGKLDINEQHIDSIVSQQREFVHRLYEQNESRIEAFDPELCRRLYLSSFIEMAMKGFYSYDRLIGQTENETKEEENIVDYVLVVAPPKEYSDLILKSPIFENPDSVFKDISDSITNIGSNHLKMKVDMPK